MNWVAVFETARLIKPPPLAGVSDLFAKNIFTKGECAQVIETIFELVKQSLEAGDDVLLSGFGKFCVRGKNERNGRNPQTGESMKLAPRRIVTFKCSGVLREKLNGGEVQPQIQTARKPMPSQHINRQGKMYQQHYKR